ncbi:hypothetical protein AAJ76_40002266 [Vairimorpha ceranae]|uniref:Uncharacterized protein n=1 Tax=Vairimorpha ceranae TaxID=40302 RepID=A0A0F9WU05_9MICR|nr:hypothetical protein AAJ76_40002266 [Vairimorpha ceranae]KKO76298.1 hypothetical protein AAJ76_40002266 [Vairimorpha ceranae]
MDNGINKKPSHRLSRCFSNKHNFPLKSSKLDTQINPFYALVIFFVSLRN